MLPSDLAFKIALLRSGGWRDLDANRLNFVAIHTQCDFDKLRTMRALNMKSDSFDAKLDDPLISACLSDAMAQYSAEKGGKTNTSVIENELWSLYRRATGREPIHQINEAGDAEEVYKTDLRTATTIMVQLTKLNATPTGPSDDEGVDPIKEAWANYCAGKANRDQAAMRFWYASWMKLKGIDLDGNDGDTPPAAPWEDRQ